MRLYGIFDQNNNYKLLRYSTDEQSETSYSYTDPITKTTVTVHEICMGDIDYIEENIGKEYDPETGLFLS